MSWYDDFINKMFKKEVEAEDYEAIFQRMDVEKFFTMARNIWAPNSVIKKIGGYSKLDSLYLDQDIYAAVDKRIASIKSARMVFDGEDQELVDWFEKQLRPHELQLKEDFWWTIFNGWGVEQIIYKDDLSGEIDGFQREQFWRFEPQKDLIHVKCINSDNPKLMNRILPYGKWVLTTNNGTSYNPYGDSMGERLIMPWIFKCTGWDLWIDFAKRFANGFMHGKIDDIKKKEEFRATLEKAAKAAIIVTGKTTELSVQQPNRDSSLYIAINDQTIRSINKVVLGETQTSDQQVRGSSASASVHNEVRIEKALADVELIQKAINEIILAIGKVNGFDENKLPKCKLIYDVTYTESDLYNVGVRFNKNYFVNRYGIKEDEFEIASTEVPSFGFSSKGKSTFLNPDDMAAFIGLSKQGHKCPVHKFDKASDEASASRKARRSENENEEIVSVLNRNSVPPLDNEDLISAILTSDNRAQLDKKLNALFDTRNNLFVDDMTNALYYAAARGAMLGNPESLSGNQEE